MARIAGIELPRNKRIEIALTYIYGIGRARSQDILQRTQIDPGKRTDELTDEEISQLREAVERGYRVEGDLRRELQANLRRLMEIGCYRGLRHRSGLPVRGQRTRTNARTRKGPKKAAVVGKKRKVKK